MDRRWRLVVTTRSTHKVGVTILGAAAALALLGCGGDKGGTDSEGDGVGPGVGPGGITLSTTSGIDPTNGGGMKFDIGQAGETENPTASGGGDCWGGGEMGNEPDFSNIWVANSVEGTVSKIDTITGTELARYVTGPEAAPEPSRTSVNLYGDAVAVNRGGGFLPQETPGPGSITKIAAREEDCIDRNGNGTIETSKGANDVKAWMQDECVIWNHHIPSDGYQHGPRPVAWEGAVGDDGCANINPSVWVGWYEYVSNTGKFRRLNGNDGTIDEEVSVPNWSPGHLTYGAYGGAVDQNLDFWVLSWQQGPLVRIDGGDLSVQVINVPQPPSGQMWAYGMALDQYGNPWIASAGNAGVYDVASGQWTWINTGNQSMRGLMVSEEDRAYFAVDGGGGLGLDGCGLAVVDVVSRTMVAPLVKIPGCSTPVGVSIDIDGFVWLVDQGANQAFKINAQNYQTALTVGGLTQPYTYSDMTGAGLKLVTFPPEG